MRLLLGLGQGRQKHCCENGYDRDDNKQFDERETGRWMRGLVRMC